MKRMKLELKNVLAKMNNFDLLKSLYATFPMKFIEDFAVVKESHGGPNYEAVEDHLKVVHDATPEQIEEVRLYLAERKSIKHSLCEALADIAYIAGNNKYYSGDSRLDIANFIDWAKEFEYLNRGIEWGMEKDYIEEIERFTLAKINVSLP